MGGNLELRADAEGNMITPRQYLRRSWGGRPSLAGQTVKVASSTSIATNHRHAFGIPVLTPEASAWEGPTLLVDPTSPAGLASSATPLTSCVARVLAAGDEEKVEPWRSIVDSLRRME